MAEPRFVRSRLHGDGQKLLVIAFEVTFEQSDYVTGRAHKFSRSIPRWSQGASVRLCRTLR
jgi:hypothetical protein